MTIPGNPTGVSTTPGDSSLKINFTPVTATPAVTKYEVNPNGTGWIYGGTSSPITVNNLGNGISHAIGLRAVNSDGASTGIVANGTPVMKTQSYLARNAPARYSGTKDRHQHRRYGTSVAQGTLMTAEEPKTKRKSRSKAKKHSDE